MARIDFEKEVRRLNSMSKQLNAGTVSPSSTDITHIRDGVRLLSRELGDIELLLAKILEELIEIKVKQK